MFPEGLADVNADLIGGGLVQAAESGLSGLNDLFFGQGPGVSAKFRPRARTLSSLEDKERLLMLTTVCLLKDSLDCR